MVASELQTIEDVDVRGKRVLVRIDADIDLAENGSLEPDGDHRLNGCLRTLQYLHDNGARIIVLGHLGRPNGHAVETLRMRVVAALLSQKMPDISIHVVQDIIGDEAKRGVTELHDGDMLVLENVRFDEREEKDDDAFAAALASLGDLFVNEAFGVAHRAHASTTGIARHLPSYAGFRFATEVHVLERAMEHPDRPLVAVVSGAKIDTKIAVLRSLLERVDQLLTGGGIANMFLQSLGNTVGDSLIDESSREEVDQLVASFKEKIVVPIDVIVSKDETGMNVRTVSVNDVQPDDYMYDLGPQTMQVYCRIVAAAKTCIWNGPLGRVEVPAFQAATREFAECLSESPAYSIVGGGDTVTILHQLGIKDSLFSHVSSGGGALIAFLEGKPLPAIDALRQAQARTHRS